jgi:hypothetical protein
MFNYAPEIGFHLIVTRFIVANRSVGTGLVASAVVSVRFSDSYIGSILTAE